MMRFTVSGHRISTAEIEKIEAALLKYKDVAEADKLTGQSKSAAILLR